MRRLRTERWSFVALVVVTLMAGCDSGDAPTISSAYVVPPVTGQTTAVGYFTLTNRSDTPLQLTSASSPMASSIEFHTHTKVGDMMRMRRLESVTIEAGERVEFRPGSLHLMVFRYSNPEGAPVPITLQFDGSRPPQTIEFEVREREPE